MRASSTLSVETAGRVRLSGSGSGKMTGSLVTSTTETVRSSSSSAVTFLHIIRGWGATIMVPPLSSHSVYTGITRHKLQIFKRIKGTLQPLTPSSASSLYFLASLRSSKASSFS